MTTKSIPLAVIGCGGHLAHHIKHFGDALHVQTAWDPKSEAMEGITMVRQSSTFEEALGSDVHAVMIGSPDRFHLDQIRQSIAAGKHVFCEKPLLVPDQELSELEAVMREAGQKRLVLFTCHPRRFDKPFVLLKHRLPGLIEKFGKVISMSFDFSYHAPSNDWKHSRSLLLDHLNHEVDLMNFFFGIQGFEAWKLSDGFNGYAVTGRRDDGITFYFEGTRHLYKSVYPEWCGIRFESGEVILDLMDGIMGVVSHDRKSTLCTYNLDIDYDGRLRQINQSFAEAILGTGPNYLTSSEMLMNTEVGIVLQGEGIKRINIR